jgi:hypothetical protein
MPWMGPHCKKRLLIFPVPSRDVTNQTLVCDVQTGEGKIANLFFTVQKYFIRNAVEISAALTENL